MGSSHQNVKQILLKLGRKGFVSAVKNKIDATEKEKVMAEKMASSYDISDVKYIEPIAAYLQENDNALY